MRPNVQRSGHGRRSWHSIARRTRKVPADFGGQTVARRKPQHFKHLSTLEKPGAGKRVVEYRPKDTLFHQGDAADGLFYVRDGKIKLTTTSSQGKEAIVAIVGPGDFVGEGCLAGQPLRMATAIAMTACSCDSTRIRST